MIGIHQRQLVSSDDALDSRIRLPVPIGFLISPQFRPRYLLRLIYCVTRLGPDQRQRPIDNQTSASSVKNSVPKITGPCAGYLQVAVHDQVSIDLEISTFKGAHHLQLPIALDLIPVHSVSHTLATDVWGPTLPRGSR